MKKITEEGGEHKKWYEEAKKVTVKTLPAFVEKLTTKYKHDYGTICHAVSASALAAAHAVDHSEVGGITGFQAGCIMWGFVTEWLGLQGKPVRLTEFSNMLYPQYEADFHSISKATWEYLQKEATKNLKSKEGVATGIKEHWQSIKNGIVPFGYSVKD